jgi:hypothetical protein
MLRRVALVRTDVSEEPGASFIRVTKISELGTTQAATSNRRTLRRNTRATRRNIPEDIILHSHRRENLKSYITDFVPDSHGAESTSSMAAVTFSSKYWMMSFYVRFEVFTAVAMKNAVF